MNTRQLLKVHASQPLVDLCSPCDFTKETPLQIQHDFYINGFIYDNGVHEATISFPQLTCNFPVSYQLS